MTVASRFLASASPTCLKTKNFADYASSAAAYRVAGASVCRNIKLMARVRCRIASVMVASSA